MTRVAGVDVRPAPPVATVSHPSRVRRRWRSVLAGVLVGLLVAAALVHHLTRSDWTIQWQDGFAGTAGSRPAAQNWLTDLGTGYPGGAAQWGTGEIETYTDDPANVGLDGAGHLRVTATRDAGGQWRSGRLETRRTDFQPAPGHTLRVSARVQLPAGGGPGYWSAFWMLGDGFRTSPTSWPGIGEIDVMENLGREPATVHGTLHCGTAPGGPCQENNGLSGARSDPHGSPLTGFHTYAVEWDRGRQEIRWYLDGERYFTVRAADVTPAAWEQATGHGFFVLLDLAVGGGWAGPPDATTKPDQSMLVDYVSVATR